MKEYASEITLIVSGLITTAGAWFLGGKQVSRNKTNETLTSGANQIVDSSKKLLETLERISEEEREKAIIERTHKESCEKSLLEHKVMLQSLSKKVACLEKKIK
jgi:hypothetical protein